MSMSSSTYKEIANSPLNTSQTKQQYSFPKQSRFDSKTDAVANCSQAFYTVPSMLSMRATSLGYGKKSDLAYKNMITPGPDNYNIKGEFDLAFEKKMGFQFGVGREKMTQQSILGQINVQNPGPGRYNIPGQLSNIKYTLRSKPELPQEKLKTTPGPGQYNSIPSINEKGVYSVSQFRNSGACIINPNTKRFVDEYANNVPGPGKYRYDNTGIQKDGHYFVNKFKSSSCRSFPHDKRLTGTFEPVEKTPGPGSYKLPSDFGHYDKQLQPAPHILQ